MEIVRFRSEYLWQKAKAYEISKEEIEIVGKFYYGSKNREKFLGELVDPNMVVITILRGEKELEVPLIEGKYYKVRGVLKKYPDLYSDNVKLFIQIKPQEIQILDETDYPEKLREDIVKIEKLEKEIKRKKADISIIKNSIGYGKNRFLYIVSDLAQNGERDILNDLYPNDYKREVLKNNFGIDLSNTIRLKFNSKDWESQLENIKNKIVKYDIIVFIKGGGSSMKFFDDIDFCTDVMSFEKTIITAVGHADDDNRLLCRLADINYSTPTSLGINFLNMVPKREFSVEETIHTSEPIFLKESSPLKTQLTALEEENKDLLNKITALKLSNEDFEKINKNLKRKLRIKNILLLFLIPLVGLFNMIYLYILNPKEKVASQSTSEIVKTEKEIIKEDKGNKVPIKQEKKKRLIYSEDEVYTVLIWKGYRGENAIINFQRDNNMKATGKIDETLLNKLGIKYRYE